MEARAELIGDLLDIIMYNQGRQFVEATHIYNGDIVNPTTEAEPNQQLFENAENLIATHTAIDPDEIVDPNSAERSNFYVDSNTSINGSNNNPNENDNMGESVTRGRPRRRGNNNNNNNVSSSGFVVNSSSSSSNSHSLSRQINSSSSSSVSSTNNGSSSSSLISLREPVEVTLEANRKTSRRPGLRNSSKSLQESLQALGISGIPSSSQSSNEEQESCHNRPDAFSAVISRSPRRARKPLLFDSDSASPIAPRSTN